MDMIKCYLQLYLQNLELFKINKNYLKGSA